MMNRVMNKLHMSRQDSATDELSGGGVEPRGAGHSHLGAGTFLGRAFSRGCPSVLFTSTPSPAPSAPPSRASSSNLCREASQRLRTGILREVHMSGAAPPSAISQAADAIAVDALCGPAPPACAQAEEAESARDGSVTRRVRDAHVRFSTPLREQ